MLLAVEGGGFFSSSASGYSKGFTLLLLGQKHRDKPMRVSPWNQYQLVHQEPHPHLHLASFKNRLSRGCACFGRASAGRDSPSILKVGPAQQQVVPPDPLVSDNGKDTAVEIEIENDGNNVRRITLKSSLKKQSSRIPVSVVNSNQCGAVSEKSGDVPAQFERRKVQWTDTNGNELAEIREFEPSESSTSDDEFENGNKSCLCAIM